MLLHAGFFSLLTIRLMQTHHIIERFPTDRFAVRFVNFHSTEPQTPLSAAAGGLRAPGQSQPTRSDERPSARKPATGGGSAASPAVTRITPQRMPAPQTLIQPDITPDVTISQQTPVPLVVIWTPDKTSLKKVVLAQPEKASIAVAQPSLDTPIKEVNVSDIKLSSTAFVTQGPAAQPSTTSPIVVYGPEAVKKVPQTSSKQPDPPTPARVVSLSDLKVSEGKVAVPMANQTAKATPGMLIPGQLKDPAPAGNGSSTTKAAGTGAGKGSGDNAGNKDDFANKSGSASEHAGAGSQTSKAGQGSPGAGTPDHSTKTTSTSGSGTQMTAKLAAPAVPKAAGANPSQSGASSGAGQGTAAGTGASGNSSASVRISLPKDGQFGVVVVGSSVADQYPETAEMWSGRMASTVYLHVGLAKSWILQYALPRLAEAAGGAHIDAPWPYEIARPNLDSGDLNADAVILHGFVNKDGRFEKLEVVFPPQMAQAPTWVGVLNQWQFRPAKQNGQAVPVEVLLIIPDQSE